MPNNYTNTMPRSFRLQLANVGSSPVSSSHAVKPKVLKDVFTTRGSSDAIKRGYKQCRMKVGAIDAAALGPF